MAGIANPETSDTLLEMTEDQGQAMKVKFRYLRILKELGMNEYRVRLRKHMEMWLVLIGREDRKPMPGSHAFLLLAEKLDSKEE